MTVCKPRVSKAARAHEMSVSVYDALLDTDIDSVKRALDWYKSQDGHDIALVAIVESSLELALDTEQGLPPRNVTYFSRLMRAYVNAHN